jgi:hypothetical protein
MYLIDFAIVLPVELGLLLLLVIVELLGQLYTASNTYKMFDPLKQLLPTPSA